MITLVIYIFSMAVIAIGPFQSFETCRLAEDVFRRRMAEETNSLQALEAWNPRCEIRSTGGKTET